MGKYIKIEVKSAKIPLQNRGANDREFSLSFDGKNFKYIDKERENFVDFQHPIHIGNISGMLHVLFGARPKATYRNSLYKSNDVIDEIAKNGLISIKTPFKRTTSNNEKELPISEFASGKKMPYNSHNNGYTTYKNGVVKGDITWHVLKYRYIWGNIEKYERIKSFIEEKTGIVDVENNITLLDALFILANSEFKGETHEFFKKENITCFADFINDVNKVNFSTCNTFKCSLSARTINTHPINEINIDCDMLFEVTEEQYDDLLNGTRYATFLDGGYAKIIPDYYLDKSDISDINEYIKISEL